MHRIIIADTSCLTILSKIDLLDVLQKLYGSVTTTEKVAQEFAQALPDWIDIVPTPASQFLHTFESIVDEGEASALALAIEIPNSTLILDDDKARKLARSYQLQFTGTIGVLVKAKRTGLITMLKPVLEKIANTDFRLSQSVISAALREANEL
jgi:predicted nucleic acid-binding protein